MFTDDVVMDTTASGGGVITGADEFMAFLQETLGDVITVHHGHMPEIELTSPTTATGVWALQDVLVWPNGMRLEGYGHYHETYAKVGRGVADRLVDVDPPPHGPHPPRRRLMGDVAVITGGASGFGLALAGRCAARGMRVALLDLDGARATDEAATLASEHGVDAVGLAVDVADGGSVSAAAAAVLDRFAGADLVISNVGVQLFGAVDRLTDDEWRWVLDVNVVGSARVARAFLPLLRRSRGRIAFTTSSSVLDPASHLGVYQASKFAVWGLAETLRLELAGDEIGVSVIFPSGMLSRHLETSGEAQPHHLRRAVADDDDLAATLASNPAMAAALATPEEAARSVIDALVAGEPYVITHGDLVGALDGRAASLRRAAEAARQV